MLTVRTKVNSRLSQRLKKDEDAPYFEQTLNFTSVSDGTPSEFPTLNVNSLGEPQAEDDLDMSEQNAIISTIELKAYTNTKLTDARNLIDKAGDVMIGMRYRLVYGPVALSDTSPFCVVARFQRLVGSGDILY